jgi:50S ribosomal subunit-associated GTPase HflX
MAAFRPTFVVLQESHLLIHLVDVSNPFFEEHIEAIEKIVSELGLGHIPRLLVFNKEDKVGPREAEAEPPAPRTGAKPRDEKRPRAHSKVSGSKPEKTRGRASGVSLPLAISSRASTVRPPSP